jgi:hypothetical protein
MAKYAFLISFTPMTRVVVDVEDPELKDIKEQMKVLEVAQQKMREAIKDYLNFDNLEILELDTEIPYGEGVDDES